MGVDPSEQVVEFVGVYHADGGPVGEAKYIIGKLLGRAHCALCDVTHSPIRRKPEWDRLVARLGTPFRLVHLNELDPDVAVATVDVGSPAVLGRLGDGSLTAVLEPGELDRLAGSVEAFGHAIQAALDRLGLTPGRL